MPPLPLDTPSPHAGPPAGVPEILREPLEALEHMLGAARHSHVMAQLATEQGGSSETVRPLLDSTGAVLEAMAAYLDEALGRGRAG